MTDRIVANASPVEFQTEEVRRLSTLLEVSRALGDTLHLKESLEKVLEILVRHDAVIRVTLTIREEGSTALQIFRSKILDASEVRSSQRSSATITRKVIDSGRPVVVPQASQEPLFKNGPMRRAIGSGGERTFLCVPLILDFKAIGALEIELRYSGDRDYDRALKFFNLLSSQVTQAIRISRLVEAERRVLVEENIHLREDLKQRYDFSNIIGTSNAMREVFEKMAQVARTNTTVLLRGESGTGKELIAHAIHYNSLRGQEPFIRVSCAALPETLIETELFGHEKGAFTGALGQKKGRFEMAEGGTLFLDEIGELQPSLQVKLLRVLQEREFERLGGIKTIRVNVRLIAATNKDLEQAISEGLFREDLYYRLNVFTIYLPPLRERQSDILLLADHFLEKYARRHSKKIKRISTPAIDMLMCYHWPGNVRELENAMERAVLTCEGHVVHGHHLPPTLQTAEASDTTVRIKLHDAVFAYEKDLILDALKSTRGNRAQAARLLGSTERIIGYKVNKYGIDCSRFH